MSGGGFARLKSESGWECVSSNQDREGKLRVEWRRWSVGCGCVGRGTGSEAAGCRWSWGSLNKPFT